MLYCVHMNQLALYRKYRPETLEDVIGQEHVIKVLKQSLKSNTPAHAYLLTGSRGIGKTTIARIIARELGTSINDLYEIDAASNNGVEEIRILRETIETLPFDSKYKVYILDEVHMLSKSAFNALLKTLEEPPAHVIFILATTDMEKVPETIVSRCQTFVFKKPSDTSLATLVQQIAKKEGRTIDEDASLLVALLGDGSFRDTLSILQQVLTLGEKTITADMVSAITGAPRIGLVHEYISGLIERDVSRAFTAVSQAASQQVDMRLFARLVLIHFRILLLLRYAPEQKNTILIHASEQDTAFYKTALTVKTTVLTSKTLEILLELLDARVPAVVATLPLEIAMIRVVEGEK